jgi:hypothetical protein
MPSRSDDYQEALSPRPLRPEERDLLAAWLAAAGDVSSAYFSNRRNDNSAMYRRIVITVEGDGEPTFLIDTPTGAKLWIVLQCRPEPKACQFRSLREALNFVRPVLSDPSEAIIDRRASSKAKRR